jgi:hypothetical protein
MFAGDAVLGCSGLLRVAGLPVRLWLAGANPTLFGKVECLARNEEVRHACAVQLAERIGKELVPHAALSRDDRGFLLALRRTLYRGDLVAKVSREHWLKVCGFCAADTELVQALVAMIDRDCATTILSAEVEVDLVQERDRLSLLSEQIYQESRWLGHSLHHKTRMKQDSKCNLAGRRAGTATSTNGAALRVRQPGARRGDG